LTSLYPSCEVVILKTQEEVGVAVEVLGLAIERIIECTERDPEYDWHEILNMTNYYKEELERLKQEAEESVNNDEYYLLAKIKEDVENLRRNIEIEEFYIQYLKRQENKSINAKLLHGLFYHQIEETISYERYIKELEDIKKAMNLAFEAKLTEVRDELTSFHQNDLNYLTEEHKREIDSLQFQIANHEEEKVVLKEESRELALKLDRITLEKDSIIDELQQTLLSKDTEFQKQIKDRDEQLDKNRQYVKAHQKKSKALTTQVTTLTIEKET
jgi:hypothetical protein